MANVRCQLSLLHFWWDIKKRVNVIFQIYLNIFPGQYFPITKYYDKIAYVFAGKFLASDAQKCVKSARIRSYSDRYFPAFALNTPFLSLSPYSGSGGMRGNADQNISKYRHFLRSSLFTYIFRGSTHQLNKNNILF